MTKGTALIVNISGPDRPGIVASFAEVLLKYAIEIVEIEQVSLQNTLVMQLLLKLDESNKFEDSVIKDLLFEGSKLNLTLTYQVIPENKIHHTSRRKLMVLTHFGDTRAVAELSKVLAEENANIEMISSGTHHDARSFEMIVNIIGVDSIGRLKSRMMAKSRELNVDLAIQNMIAQRKNKRMICFDMDSTLVSMEGIDEMARRADVHREVARITKKAMRGDFDFEESLTQRVAMLKGLALDDVMDIRNNMILSEGADELLTTLKWLGFRVGIVSGGFDIFAEYLKDRLNLDFAFANQLEIKNGLLTGKVQGEIIDAAQKARILSQISCDFAIPLDQVVAVGDGANDALMLTQAGLGIAYNAKKDLHKVANAALSKAHFNHIFHLLGITEEDIDEAMSCKEL
ncbi:phosphoserine phosphatase SerB [Thermodesulfobacteriota bacterium]